MSYFPPRPPKTYLFIDGSNFRQYFNEITEKWFGHEVEFEFKQIKELFKAEKAFYYDCIDDIKDDHENDKQFKQRVDSQEEKLNKIREVEGCHVYLGSLSGKGKKKRQKEVDVLLAVQMMEHAINGNMQKVILLSGDKDFRPLVESLVRLGLFVEVTADQNHISNDLIHAADSHRKLSIDEYYEWTYPKFKTNKLRDYKNLTFSIEGAESEGFKLIKKGLAGKIQVFIYNRNQEFWLTTDNANLHNNTAWVGNDIDNLSLYFEIKFRSIEWE